VVIIIIAMHTSRAPALAKDSPQPPVNTHIFRRWLRGENPGYTVSGGHLDVKIAMGRNIL
jgi:hypothetical protein